MSKKTKTFDIFGVQYRTVQFSAARGMEFIGAQVDSHPCDFLSETQVKLFNGAWAVLDADSINLNVIDKASIVAPRLVLEGLLSVVREFNFGFLSEWKSTRVPSRFVESGGAVTSQYTEPLLAQLIQDDVAKMRDLEEYYSLEDAFRMFDILLVKGINQALSNEASVKRSKQR